MASNLWCQDLIAAGVPDGMAKELAATYTNRRVFFFSFKSVDALDVCTKKVAHKVGLISETEGDVADSHPAIGAVRAFRIRSKARSHYRMQQGAFCQAHRQLRLCCLWSHPRVFPLASAKL